MGKGKLRLNCPECGKSLSANVEVAGSGRTVRCPGCEHGFKVQPLSPEEEWQARGSILTRNVFTGQRESKGGMPHLYGLLVAIAAAFLVFLVKALF